MYHMQIFGMLSEHRALPQHLCIPVRNDCCAICIVGEEESPDSKVILDSPVIGLWGPIVKLSNKCNGLG